MTDDRVSIELIDAGEQKERVVLVLSKVKGLTMAPQQIVSNTPCTVAMNVPKSIAEKLKGYLEKAGAIVMLEGEDQQDEEDLFDSAEISSPEDEDEEMEFEPLSDDESEEEYGASELLDELAEPLESPEEELFGESEEMPLPDVAVSPELPEIDEEQESTIEEKRGGLQQLLANLPLIGRKRGQTIEENVPGMESGMARGSSVKSSLLAVLSKFQKPKVSLETETLLPEDTGMEAATPVAESGASGVPMGRSFGRRGPDLMNHPVVLFCIGALTGAIIAGILGQLTINSLRQDRLDFESQTVAQIEEHSAGLKSMVQQLQEQSEMVKQRNAELEKQMAALIAFLESGQQPKGIFPSQTPTEMTPWENDLVTSFQEVMGRHMQSLENGYEAQKTAGCSQQLLLDGKSTHTFAQVVKKFSTKYTRYDIRHSDSITTPYVAELKIPFQQELKIGKTKDACNAAQLKQLETPVHHEFGGYYGIWTIEYLYRGGRWVVDQTVSERNRALYDSAFQNGSPDYAKFRIDTDLFPEFK